MGFRHNAVPDGCNYVPTPSATDYKPRHEGHAWSGIVIHHTGILSNPVPDLFERMVSWLTKKDDVYVSSHALIGDDGSVAILVNPDTGIAYHAGKSQWFNYKGDFRKGKYLPKLQSNCNDYMLGIELVGDGNVGCFTDPQYAALSSLCRHWCNRYNLAPQAIVGHMDIAPDRKVDPGTYFSFSRLYRKMYQDG